MKLNEQTLDALKQSINQIGPDTAPVWGSLTPAQILRHLRAHLDVSLEREPVPDESNLMSRTVLKWLTFNVMTRWPKGLPAPKEFFPEPMQVFQEERSALLQAMEEFVRESSRQPDKRVLSRGFGRATLRYWQRMHGLHFKHHLRQLGL